MLKLPVHASKNKTQKLQADLVDPTKTGAKKACLIGINYTGASSGVLGGCINDVKNLKSALLSSFGFSESNMRCLTDDAANDANNLPTRKNIIEGMNWLVNGAKQGDTLFFSYSGHGSQTRCTDGSEEDGMNEVLCPVDYLQAGIIMDDVVHDILHDKLPIGVRLIAVFDCCHSGSMADLPVQRDMGFDIEDMEELQKIKAEEVPQDVLSRFLELPPEIRDKQTITSCPRDPKFTGTKDLFVVSGCQDNQTSADASIGGQRQGALTYVIIWALKKHGWHLKYDELLKTMRNELRRMGFDQVPAISTTHQELFRSYVLGNSPVLAIEPIPVPAPAPHLSPGSGVLVADFTDTAPDVLKVGLGWAMGSKKAVDLDASAVFLDADKGEIALAFFKNLKPEGLNEAVLHHGDNRTGKGEGDDESITIDLEKLPLTVHYIGLVINSYTGQKLSSIKDAYCRLYNAADPAADLARFDIGSDRKKFDDTALLMAVLHRTDKRWYMLAAGEVAGGKTVKSNVDECQDFIKRKLSKPVCVAAKPLTVCVTVPDDCTAGDTLDVHTPGGFDVSVTVPKEAGPGTRLQFEVRPAYVCPS